MKKTSRRKFIISSATVGIGSMLAAPSLNQLFATDRHVNHFGFDQQPLAYPYNALEPSIDALTMEIHYTKHAAAYSKNVKEAATAEGVNMKQPIEDLLKTISKYSAKMRNNAGGHYNHELFWKTLSPKATAPSGKLADAITKSFGSPDEFKKQFNEAAKSRFGSGWAWLVLNSDKKLVISSTPNQDNPLMDIAEVKGFPVFGLDVWEHAYYLKYQNRRADYIDGFWKVINWEFVSERYNSL
ncbi:MAG: superoxide dismutase [Chitinophagaceae bacterium]|nr:superoxide dismutase [Chitinophagaceae bacterium]